MTTGERSYSSYLVHLGVILLLQDAFGPTQHAWHRAAFFAPLVLGLAIVVGELLHRTVERPAMRIAARRRAQERVQAATLSRLAPRGRTG